MPPGTLCLSSFQRVLRGVYRLPNVKDRQSAFNARVPSSCRRRCYARLRDRQPTLFQTHIPESGSPDSYSIDGLTNMLNRVGSIRRNFCLASRRPGLAKHRLKGPASEQSYRTNRRQEPQFGGPAAGQS